MKNENQHFSADRRKFGRHFWIGAAVAGALSAAVIFTAASAVYRKNRFDLKIGEEKVGSKEYQLCMDLVKYDVKMEIQKRYDALYGEDFWEQSYEGQYGYEILADHTVEKIKYIHAVYDLAEEYGVSTMTIRRILCEAENADKIKALKEARLAQAQLRILEQVPIALDRNEEILETNYDPAFQYLWQNAIRDTLDRAGIKAPKEEERDINITFTGGGFDVNLPEDDGE